MFYNEFLYISSTVSFVAFVGAIASLSLIHIQMCIRDSTGIVNALHLIGVNEGYTSDKLQIEKTETVYESADESSLLNELSSGVDVYKRQLLLRLY